MKLHYGMSKEDWRELLLALKNQKGVTLTKFAEVDEDMLFVDIKYILVEYANMFFYIEERWDVFDGITITAYGKVSPYEQRQIEYPHRVSTLGEIIEYIQRNRRIGFFAKAPTQRINGIELYGMSNGRTALYHLEHELAGNREKDVLYNLDRIEMVANKKNYKVLRFHHRDGEHFFDYECYSKRITG